MTASLAYRKNEAAILRGDVPEKYTRLLPHIPGETIVEIGSAEGVLALLLARSGKRVIALEPQTSRHEGALNLCRQWRRAEPFPTPTFANGTIGDNLHLLSGADTFVAVRVIYYLRDDIDRVFAQVARKVQNVVLCGNRNRADRWRAGRPDQPLDEWNRYAAREGMRGLLERHGYRIVREVTEGDEIVVGFKDG